MRKRHIVCENVCQKGVRLNTNIPSAIWSIINVFDKSQGLDTYITDTHNTEKTALF